MALNLFSTSIARAEDEKQKQDTKLYELEIMTVTAEKREENIQDVPVSITALSETQIEDSGITSIKDLSLQIPNLNIVSWGTRRCSYIYNRGIGATNNAPAVGFYVDDVAHFEWGTFDIELFDIERIEVLRGPQGTLYGRNTLGGVVNIITKKPENYAEGTASVTFGNYDRQDYRVAFRTPVIKDKLFFGVSGVRSVRDGYTKNDFLNSDVDNRDGLSGRAHVRWLPSDTLDITLSASGENQDDGAYPLGPLGEVQKNPHHVSYDFEGKHESDLYGSSLRIGYEAPQFKLTSITGWQSWDNKDSADQDFTPADFFTSFADEDHTQLTQEIRLASPENAGSLKWLAGAYCFNEDFDRDLIIDFGVDAVAAGFVPALMKNLSLAQFYNKGYALFGQVTYTIFDKLDLTAGLRYDYEKKKMDLNKFMEMGGMAIPGTEFEASPEEDFSEWLPKFVAAYRWIPNLMTYASVTRGYRSGGFNESFINPSDISFDPEYSWNYELGLKSSWLDNRFIMNTAAFYIDWKDQQVIQLLPTGAETSFRNAGESHSQGFEVEMIARPTEGLDLIAGFGYTDAKFDEYKDTIAGTDYKDNRTPLTPRYTYNLAAQYRHPLTGSTDIFGRVDVNGVGKSYWNDANTLKQDPYELANARLGFETDYFEVYLWAKNIFETEYEAIAFEFPGFPPLAQAGDPRTFGITLTGRF
jgi:iron complex outermembrane receptor protein